MDLDAIKNQLSKDIALESVNRFRKKAKKEITEQISVFAERKANGKQKSVEYFEAERTEIIKDKDGKELYTIRTNSNNSSTFYQYIDSKNQRVVCFIDKDSDGNIDEVEIVNYSFEEAYLKKGTPWIIKGFDEDDDGTFDSVSGHLAKEKSYEKTKLSEN